MKKLLLAVLCCTAAQWSLAKWYESGGYVVIEPEHVGLVEDWVTRPSTYLDDPTMAGSLGDGWLEWTGAQFSGNTKTELGVTGVLTYDFEIQTEGNYFFRWRTKQYSDVGAGDAGNDTFVAHPTGSPVDGYYDFTLFTKSWVQNKTAWDWRTAFEPSHGEQYYNQTVRYYTPGTHTIKLAARSPGHAIDRIVLYHESHTFSETTFNSLPESASDNEIKWLYKATNDVWSITGGEVPYYVDSARDALAINAANTSYRGKFARAEMTYPDEAGEFDVTITTLTEEDGESTYRLLINGTQVGTYQNPRVGEAGDMQPNEHTWSNITIGAGATIAIESDTHSNGLIPEAGGFAWSRGRWRQIQLKESAAPPPSSAAQNTPAAGQYGDRSSGGSFKKWHRVTVAFEGPNTSETAASNPFLNYRLNVTFEHPASGKSYLVPGYYAADGNPGESGADSGNIWRVHFAPDELGSWNYTASFRTGNNVAVDDSPTAGSPTAFDGEVGSFNVVASDKGGLDLRGKGRLLYSGTERYLRHAETGEAFIKTGADAPENFLAFDEIDGTYSYDGSRNYLKSWASHIMDWEEGDPAWKGKGKGIIGAINYLASEGQNVFSFLTYNAGGDCRDVWPFVHYEDKLHYDCSKLDQWEIIFSHGEARGMYLHFKTQETENDNHVTWGLDGGAVGTERKLYYRELIARFAHHMALNWNLGEENNQTEAQQKEMAQYFHDHDPYGHNIVLHTYPGEHYRYDWHLGSASELTGASIQTDYSKVHQDTLSLINKSVAAGQPWIVANDEQGPSGWANPPDGEASRAPYQSDMRQSVVWGNLMAGGAGIELYAGYEYSQSDLYLDDFRSRDRMWDYCRHAKDFFNKYLPFDEMENANSLIGNTSNNNDKYCFAKAGEVYAVFLANGGTTTLNLSGASGTFPVYWFNPRDGGDLQVGSVTSVAGGGSVSLGNAPSETSEDWAVLVGKALYAGDNQVTSFPQSANEIAVNLDATVLTGADPNTVQWSLLSGPGTVVFTDDSSEDTSATITGGTGLYTLQIEAVSGSTVLVDTLTVDVNGYTLSGNVEPAFTTNSMTRANATVTQEYSATLAGSAYDLNPGDFLTYSKVAGPAWLNVAGNGALSGTPGMDDTGLNEFIVRVQDTEGAFDTAALYIIVDESPSVSDELVALADAYVQGGIFSNDNFGAETELLCKTDAGNESFTRQSYLRFDLSNVTTNPIGKATLRLKVAENYGSGAAHALHRVDDDTWGESTITWSNKPAAGVELTTAIPPSSGWLELDITSQVAAEIAGDRVLSLALISADLGPVSYYSREAGSGSRPELVIETNSVPAFIIDPINGNQATEGVAYSDSIADTAEDPNANDILTFSKESGPAWLSVAADGTLSGTPGAGDIGLNIFSVKVEDNALASDTAVLNITVQSNTPPSFAAASFGRPDATEGAAYGDTVAGTASDPDTANTLTYSKVDGPAWLSVAADGSISGTPGAADVGPNTWTIRVEDDLLASDTAELNISVLLGVAPPAVTNTVDFTAAEGYSDGILKNNHLDWSCEKTAMIAEAAGIGWAVLAPGYGNNAYNRGVPVNQDAFTVSMTFSFTSSNNAERKPVMNVGFYGSNLYSAEKLKASLFRDRANGVQIMLEGSGWYEQLGFTSALIPLSAIGLADGTDLDSDMLKMTATLNRGATASEWTMTSRLYNLTTDPTASTPLIDFTQTGITHAGLFASDTLYGGFGGGQSDDNSGTSNRKLDTFTFIGENFGGGTGWKQYVGSFGLSGIPSADSDGDGESDLYEISMNGDPTNAAVLAAGIAMEYGSNDVVSLYHPMMAHDNPGIVYETEWCTNLTDGTWINSWDSETVYPTTDPDYDEAELQVSGENKREMFFRVTPGLE